MNLLSKTKISSYSSLKTAKMRTRHSMFVAEGTKCVRDLLSVFRLEALIATECWFESHKSLIEGKEMSCYVSDEISIRKISSLSTPPDVLAVFHIPEEDALVKINSDSLYLMLDGIQDPGNLGTIIRTADWFGFTEIYASRDTVDVYNPKVVQGTMGSLARVRVIYTDISRLIKESSISNVFGTLLDGKDMFAEELPSSGVIIMGNEGKGLSEEVRRLVNNPLYIPPYNPGSHGESLNVAIATAITLARFRFPGR